MAEHTKNDVYDEQVAAATKVETTDRGMFDFVKKDGDKEELKPTSDDKFASEFDDKVRVSEEAGVVEKEEEAKHGSLLDKFHQADDADAGSSSASSSDEEDDEEKKKMKREKRERKGIKEKLFEKLPGHKDEENTSAPIEKPQVHEAVYSEPSHVEEDVEKKGCMDKIKEKIPGHKKAEDHHEAVPETVVVKEEVEVEEKKGLMDRIKDKIPGLGPKVDHDKKDHE